jgi:hypothetical protein
MKLGVLVDMPMPSEQALQDGNVLVRRMPVRGNLGTVRELEPQREEARLDGSPPAWPSGPRAAPAGPHLMSPGVSRMRGVRLYWLRRRGQAPDRSRRPRCADHHQSHHVRVH